MNDVQRAVELAHQLQQRSAALQTPQELSQQAELDRMIQHPSDRATLVELTDQAFRSNTAWRSADQLTHILDVQGVPRFFSPLDRTLLRGFQSFGGYLPGVAVPLVKEKMQHETANVILPAEPELLGPHLQARRAEGVRMNVNFLGEALLGEAEAARRLEHYRQALRNPDIEVVSVKISTLFSQISVVARQQTIETLCDRMESLYREAAAGREAPKFVYMDMEEYRDMSITAEVFMRTLDRPDLSNIPAGLVLQAYVPDSFRTQRTLTEWALRRRQRGGAPVTLRIVKGANMEMERVVASLSGWECATFQHKRDTDANFKRMLHYGLEPDHARAVRIGVASHNLFELAYGLVLARERGIEDCVQFEMLEGMANHQRRALFEQTSELLLYAPACRREDFVYAIGYLIRRLDENSGPSNFLRHAFRVTVDSEAWRALERDFVEAFDRIADLPDTPRRRQDRRRAPQPALAAQAPLDQFVNEPDTDFALYHHESWVESIYQRWMGRHTDAAVEASLVIGGREIMDGHAIRESTDPSRPGVVVGRYRVASVADVDAAVACAIEDPDRWREKSAAERGERLRAAAQAIRERRADLLGIALAEAGKILAESDPEVSEAVDFCEYYARAAEFLANRANLDVSGRGVVAVVPPWNFPIAIPCGGVAAALAAGNTVILKPAPESVQTAYILCECFWSSGIGRSALQFVSGDNDDVAAHLVAHGDVDTVVFTGGTKTAFAMLSQRPAMRLLAETGGKNAMIVTAMSDRDLAISDCVQSAFGHSGQKCSATSLLILEREVFDDAGFRRSLCDAVESLPVGSAWDPTTRVGPLIRPPSGALATALRRLDEGESWAVTPRPDAQNPNLWSPGVKWGVAPNSPGHTTEFFGPVLSVMAAADLDEAIALANATGYGLTAGLHSLDDREWQTWSHKIRAGNLYINRGTTGAIVGRQPFGGVARSAIGPGLKAGGPNYVVPLMRVSDRSAPPAVDAAEDAKLGPLFAALADRPELDSTEFERLLAAAGSYQLAMTEEFGSDHDSFRLVGQDNLRRYLPLAALRVRIDRADSDFEVFAMVIAAHTAQCPPTVSSRSGWDGRVALLREWSRRAEVAVEFVEETDAEVAEAIEAGQTDRLRFASAQRVPELVRRSAAATGLYLATEPVLADGRIELLHYLREQSLCVNYHRYGNLAGRAAEQRSQVL